MRGDFLESGQAEARNMSPAGIEAKLTLATATLAEIEGLYG